MSTPRATAKAAGVDPSSATSRSPSSSLETTKPPDACGRHATITSEKSNQPRAHATWKGWASPK